MSVKNVEVYRIFKTTRGMKENELIAKFMGFKPYEDGRYGTMWPDPSREGNPVVIGMNYHKSWDWLMPVIEKIYELEDGVKRRSVTFTLKNSRAVIKDGKKTFSCHTIVPLNSAYRVVVQFIEYYNSQVLDFVTVRELKK